MNRREFLQSLAALGAAIAIPIDLATASTRDINAAWKAARLEPAIFTVADYGTLSIGEYEEPGSRAEMYRIQAEWSNREELAEVIHSDWQLEDIAETTFADVMEEINADLGPEQAISFDSWEDWLATASDDHVGYLENNLREWLEEKPDVGAEFDWLPPMNLVTPTGAAYSFFKAQDDALLGALGIVFIEGSTPCSSYFGAELRRDITEANDEAEARGLPIRFVAE